MVPSEKRAASFIRIFKAKIGLDSVSILKLDPASANWFKRRPQKISSCKWVALNKLLSKRLNIGWGRMKKSRKAGYCFIRFPAVAASRKTWRKTKKQLSRLR
jgi:hypothetical protein